MKNLKSLPVLGFALTFSLTFQEGFAQTWDELFRQKETQKEYLILQVGALEIQSRLLAESGSIARYGLEAIRNWKGLEKEVHASFFDSYKTLGPLSRAAYETIISSGLAPEILLERIEKSKIKWMGESLDQKFLDWNNKIHQAMKSRCLGFRDFLNRILGMDLEMEDADRAMLLDQVGTGLIEIQKDLGKLQVSSAQRLRMNREKMKWQREQANY